MTFEAWCKFLGPTEGGFSNDPRDPGNWTGASPGQGKLLGTKFGIAAGSHPTLDIPNLTLAQANAIRKTEYWDKVRGDELPAALAILVADAAYASGPFAAIELLQTSLGVKADGIIGEITMAAIDAAQIHLDELIGEFCSRRMLFLVNLNTWQTFRGGWTRRLFRGLILALSLDQPAQQRPRTMFTPSGVANLIKTVAHNLDETTPLLAMQPNIKPEAVAHINNALQAVQTSADGFAKADNAADAKDTLGRALDDLDGVLNGLAVLPLPPQVAVPMRIAAILLPVFRSAGPMVIAQVHQLQGGAAHV